MTVRSCVRPTCTRREESPAGAANCRAMRGRVPLLVALGAVGAVAALGAASLTPADGAAAAARPFLVGAATVDITPPAFDAAADEAAFPDCPPALFGGP